MASPSTDKPQPTDTAQQPSASKPRRRIVRRLSAAVAAVFVALLAYLFLWPSPIDSVAYEPPPKPALEGPLAPNNLLESAELLGAGRFVGPEDVGDSLLSAALEGAAAG